MHANIHLNAISRSHQKSAVGASAYRSGRTLQNRSIVAAAAYRSGEVLEDKRESVVKKTYDYTRKQNVEASGLLTPDHAPEWAKDRESYWNAVEAKEKRKDALLAKEAILVLPRNLSKDQHKQVVENWARKNLVEKRGLVVDYAIHNPHASDGGRNPHAHVLYYPRPIDKEGQWGKKLTGYKTENTVDGTKVLKQFRQSYENELNAVVIEANDNKQKVFDLRSYRERGIAKKPQPKVGWKAAAMERKGMATDRGRNVKKVMAINAAEQGRRKHIKTTRLIGSSVSSRSGLTDQARDKLGSAYYDLMYGDGSDGSFKRQQEEHER